MSELKNYFPQTDEKESSDFIIHIEDCVQVNNNTSIEAGSITDSAKSDDLKANWDSVDASKHEEEQRVNNMTSIEAGSINDSTKGDDLKADWDSVDASQHEEEHMVNNTDATEHKAHREAAENIIDSKANVNFVDASQHEEEQRALNSGWTSISERIMKQREEAYKEKIKSLAEEKNNAEMDLFAARSKHMKQQRKANEENKRLNEGQKQLMENVKQKDELVKQKDELVKQKDELLRQQDFSIQVVFTFASIILALGLGYFLGRRDSY